MTGEGPAHRQALAELCGRKAAPRIGLGLIAADIGCMEMPGSTSQHPVLAA